MKKISTNGRCIFFSPDFVDKLYCHELDFILSHQIMHIVCGNIWRPEDLSGDNYHFACDIRINRLLEAFGFSEEKYAHLGSVYRQIPGLPQDPAEMTPEEIYTNLPYSLYIFDARTRNRFLPDNDGYWDRKEDNGHDGILILDIPALDGMLRQQDEAVGKREENSADDGGIVLKQVWQGRTAAAAKSLSGAKEGGGIGNVPDFIKRMIPRMKEPTVDWKKILNNFLQERTCDYSFSPPDRRYSDTGFFLPDFNEKEFVSRDVLFMVDTSESVDDENLAVVYSEIKGAIEQFNGKLSGKLGFFDADVKTPLPFETPDDLLQIIPYGGGGTDFRPIFEYVRNHYQDALPACIVIFTDGCGPYPDEKAAMHIPVLWLINNLDITPPWGKTARLRPSAAPD